MSKPWDERAAELVAAGADPDWAAERAVDQTLSQDDLPCTAGHCYHSEQDPDCKAVVKKWISVCCRCGRVRR